MLTNGDREGRIFLFRHHTNNGLYFLHTIKHDISITEVPEYAEMRHNLVTILYRTDDVTSLAKCVFLMEYCGAVRLFLSFPRVNYDFLTYQYIQDRVIPMLVKKVPHGYPCEISVTYR